MPLRTGSDYRESLRDGRNVHVLGVGQIKDVTTHPITKPVVDTCAQWYDRHSDPAWENDLFRNHGEKEEGRPLLLQMPKTSKDLRQMSEAIKRIAFLSAGNMTHTPSYGACIALFALDMCKALNSPPDRVAAAETYRGTVEKGRYITYASGLTVPSDRFRPPDKCLGLKLVKEADGGVIISGRLSLSTMVPFVEEVYVNGGVWSKDINHRVNCVVPLNSKGVKIICRQPSVRSQDAYISNHFDELDAHISLDNVFVPYEKVFSIRHDYGVIDIMKVDHRWMVWHQLITVLSRMEFTLGLVLSVMSAAGLKEVEAIQAQVVELVMGVETVRACLIAAELNPEISVGGFLSPRVIHLAPGMIYALKNRQLASETLRNLAGQSGVLHPTMADFNNDAIKDDLELAFSGGEFTAKQRAALMQLVWDHVASSLDGREGAFENNATGTVNTWKERLKAWFDRYDEVANMSLKTISSLDMPHLNFDILRTTRVFKRKNTA